MLLEDVFILIKNHHRHIMIKNNSLTKMLILILSAYLFLTPNVYAAKFYKWTDDDGNVHYGDKAPEDNKSAETVHVSTQKSSTSTNSSTSSSDDSEKPNLENDNMKEKQSEDLKKYCKDVSNNIKTLEIGGRIQTKSSDGSKKFLDAGEQKSQLDKYKKQYSERCSQ